MPDECPSRIARGERPVWQRRYWEHTLRDDKDFRRHVEYIHANPVRHGLVVCAHDWPHSSFHRWVREGLYDRDWYCSCGGTELPSLAPVGDFDRFAE